MTDGGRQSIGKDVFASYLRSSKAKFSRCLEPSGQCTRRAIRAHSIQNSRVLDFLARDGHVVAPTVSTSLDEGLRIEFAPVGRNRATTFAGLCSRHDHEIFAPIDKVHINLSDEEQLFLLAYRAAYRELHASIEAAVKVQTAYLERVERGLDPIDSPSPAGLAATQRLAIAYNTFCYKSFLDPAHAGRDFAAVVHDVIHFDIERPTVSVCSLFSVDKIHAREDVLRVHINVFPFSANRTTAVFSYLRSDAPLARGFLTRILEARGAHQRYELSRLILHSCENFVRCPNYFDKWTDEKKEAVQAYFERTVEEYDPEYESQELYLF